LYSQTAGSRLKLKKMTKQQKIKAIERRLYKVSFLMNSTNIIVRNIGACVKQSITYNSVNEAYNSIVKGI
jgi:hypothetical protein